MNYKDAAAHCHVLSAIYRQSVGIRYWKNHSESLDSRVPELDKLADDWAEYDPRDYDNGSLFMFND